MKEWAVASSVAQPFLVKKAFRVMPVVASLFLVTLPMVKLEAKWFVW